MDQAIIGDDVGHREDPVVPLLGQHVTAGPGQCPVRADQRVVHAVDAPGDRPDTVEVQQRSRRAGQDARLGAGADQRAQRRGGQLDVRVEVDPGKRPADLVAHAQRVRLSGHVRLEYPDAVHPPRRGRRAVAAGVGDHHDVDLARRGAVQQSPQVAGDHRFLVVRRQDDADHGFAHGAQDNRMTIGARRP
jgi:hypothetical protein